MGCFPERASAHLPGYLNGPTVGIDGEQGGVGEINIRLTALASSEGSFASRCHSRKLGKCRTLLYQGLILIRRTGQIDQHSTHQVEVWRRNEIDSNNIGQMQLSWSGSFSRICIPAWVWKMDTKYSSEATHDLCFGLSQMFTMLERSQGVKVNGCTQTFSRERGSQGIARTPSSCLGSLCQVELTDNF